VRKLHGAVIGLSLLGGLAGCAPAAKLVANPTVVCPGRAVRLTWEGSSAGVITSEPASPEGSGLGEVAASGSRTVRPRTSTIYRFEVGSVFAKRTAATTVRVPEAPKEGVRIAPSGSAEDGVACLGDRIRATAHVPADAWDARLRVDLVSSADGRSYQVSHQVARDRVGPDASAAFRDLPLAGAWTLETALRPGEECGATPPESLSLQVSLICAD
jgi:hypothetical protein